MTTTLRHEPQTHADMQHSGVTARAQGDGILLRSNAASWASTLPREAGSMTPADYWLGGIAGTAAAYIRDTLGPEMRIEIWDVEARAHASAPSLETLTLDLAVCSPYNAQVVERLFDAWRERCPGALSLPATTDVSVRCEYRTV